MKLLLLRVDSTLLYQLDNVSIDKEQFAIYFRSENSAFIGAITAFKYGHPIMEDWKMMRYCTANFLYCMSIWEALIRFTSCYPTEHRMVEWTINYVWMVYPRSTELSCLRVQAHNKLRTNSMAFTNSMEDSLDDLLQHTIYSTALVKGFWESVSKGNSNEIKGSSSQLQKHIHKVDKRFQYIANKNPCSPQIIFDYLHFLSSTCANPINYVKYGRAYSRMRSGGQIWDDQYNENATSLFSNLIQEIHPKRYSNGANSQDNQPIDEEGSSSSINLQMEYEDLNETEIEDMSFLISVVEEMQVPFIHHIICALTIITLVLSISMIGLLGMGYEMIRYFGSNELEEVEKKSELTSYISFICVVLNRYVTKLTEREHIDGQEIVNCDMNMVLTHSYLSMIKQTAINTNKLSIEVAQMIYDDNDNNTIITNFDKLINITYMVSRLQGKENAIEWIEKNIEEFSHVRHSLIKEITDSCAIQAKRFGQIQVSILKWKSTVTIVTSLVIVGINLIMCVFLSRKIYCFIESISHCLMMIPKRFINRAIQRASINLKELEPDAEKDKSYQVIREKMVNNTLQPIENRIWLTNTPEILFWMFSLLLSITLIGMLVTFIEITEQYSQIFSSVIPQCVHKQLVEVSIGLLISSYYSLGFIDSFFNNKFKDLKTDILKVTEPILRKFDNELHVVMMGNSTINMNPLYFDGYSYLWMSESCKNDKWMEYHNFFECVSPIGEFLLMRGQLARLNSIQYVPQLLSYYSFTKEHMFPQSHYYLKHISKNLVDSVYSSQNYRFTPQIFHPVRKVISCSLVFLLFVCLFIIGCIYSLKYLKKYIHEQLYCVLAIHSTDILGITAISNILSGNYKSAYKPEKAFDKDFFNRLSHEQGEFLIIYTDVRFIIKSANKTAMERLNLTIGQNFQNIVKDRKLWNRLDGAINGKVQFNFTTKVATKEESYSILVIARGEDSTIESSINKLQSIDGFIFVMENISQLARASRELIKTTASVTKLMQTFIPNNLINNFIEGSLDSSSFNIQTSSIAMVSLGNLNNPGPERERLVQLHNAFFMELDKLVASNSNLTRVNAFSHAYIVVSGVFSGRGLSPEIGARDCTAFAVDAVKLIESGICGRGVGAKSAVISGGQMNVVISNGEMPYVEVISNLIDSAQKALCNTKVGHVVIFESTRVLLRNTDFSVKERRGNSPLSDQNMKIFSIRL